MTSQPSNLVRDPAAQLNFESARVPVVTRLPAMPYDGQEVLVDASAGQPTEGTGVSPGVLWRFRFFAADTSAYKWRFVGGPPLHQRNGRGNSVTVNHTVNTWGEGSSGSGGSNLRMRLIAPLAGEYIMQFGAGQMNPSTAGGEVRMGLAYAGAASAEEPVILVYSVDGLIAAGANERWRAMAASEQILALYHANNTTATLRERFLNLIPVRVG